jgi:hypothetical protein
MDSNIKYFYNNDCFLLEDEYINWKTPMRFLAQCGHENTITFDAFKNSNASKKCKKNLVGGLDPGAS